MKAELKERIAACKKMARDLTSRITQLKKQTESDAALIASLNRYIEALEGKAAMQTELIQELRERLDTILALHNNLDAIQKKHPRRNAASATHEGQR